MVDRRRLFRAQHQDISIKNEIGPEKYVVKGTRNRMYDVDLRTPSCTCPDWKKRKPSGGCKHILFVKIKKERLDSLPSAKTTFSSQNRSSTRNIPNWERLARQIKKQDNWTCQHCGKKSEQFGLIELHAHHIIPRSKGGEDTLDNLITVCDSCHEELHGHSISTKGGSSSNEKPSDSQIDSGSGSAVTKENSVCKSCGTYLERDSTMRELCDDCLTNKTPNRQRTENPPQKPVSLRHSSSKNQILNSSMKNKNDSFTSNLEETKDEETYADIGVALLFLGGIGLFYSWKLYSHSEQFLPVGMFLVAAYGLIRGSQVLVKKDLLTRYSGLSPNFRKSITALTMFGVIMTLPAGVAVLAMMYGDVDVYSPDGIVVLFYLGLSLLALRQLLLFYKT